MKISEKIFGKLKLVPLNYGKLQAQCGSWNLDSKTQWRNLPGRSWDLFWGTHPAHDDFQFIYKEWALGNQSEYPDFPSATLLLVFFTEVITCSLASPRALEKTPGFQGKGILAKMVFKCENRRQVFSDLQDPWSISQEPNPEGS